MFPRRLFGGQEALLNFLSYPILAFLDDHPNTRSSKNIQRNKKVPSTKHAINCASALTLEGCLQQVTLILQPRFGCIITLDSSTLPKIQLYMITIGSFLACSCPYFQEMKTKACVANGQVASILIIFLLSYAAYPLRWIFYAPNFSFNEVKWVLGSGIRTHHIP
jgi:hypothetical protein